MEKYKLLSEQSAPIDISNYNYKEFYSGQKIDIYMSWHAQRNSCIASGSLIFVIVCDDKIPIISHQHNGIMLGDDCDSDDDEAWNSCLSKPIDNSLWSLSGPDKDQIHTGTLRLPTNGKLFVPVIFRFVNIFGDYIDAHFSLLLFDIDKKTCGIFRTKMVQVSLDINSLRTL